MSKFRLTKSTFIYAGPTSGKSTLIANSSVPIIDSDDVLFKMLMSKDERAELGRLKPAPWFASGVDRLQFNLLSRAALMITCRIGLELKIPVLTNLIPMKKATWFKHSYALGRTSEDLVKKGLSRMQKLGQSQSEMDEFTKVAKNWGTNRKFLSGIASKTHMLDEDEYLADLFLDVDSLITDENEVKRLNLLKTADLFKKIDSSWTSLTRINF